MAKLKRDDHVIMGWIGFGRGQKNATVQEAAGYLDYYERDEYTPERFETCLQRLEAAGLILSEGLSVKPSDKARALWKGCWTRKSRVLEFFNLPNDHGSRYDAAFYAIEIPNTPKNPDDSL